MSRPGFQEHTVTRYASAAPVGGRAVVGAESTITATGSLQALSSRDIQFLEPGLRARGRWEFFTFDQLQYGVANTYADRLHHNGRLLEVIGEENFSDARAIDSGQNYRMYILGEEEH